MDYRVGSLLFPKFFVLFLGLDYLVNGFFLHITGWVYLLPNHTYLHVLALLPLLAFFIVRVFSSRLPAWSFLVLAGVLLLGGVAYFLAARAQLWRMWIFPIGLLTLTMGFVMLFEAFYIVHNSSLAMRQKVIFTTIGCIALLALSTVYSQPWALVSKLPEVSGGNFKRLDMSDTYLNLVKFNNTDFEKVNFSGASLIGVDFKDVNLNGVSFRNAKIENVNFTNVSLKSADFTGADIYQSNFEGSDMRSVIFSPEHVGRTHIIESRLCGATYVSSMCAEYTWSGSRGDKGEFPSDLDLNCSEKFYKIYISKNEYCAANPH